MWSDGLTGYPRDDGRKGIRNLVAVLAAGILAGRKVAKNVRCIVVPATRQIFGQAAREGLLEIFADAGVIVLRKSRRRGRSEVIRPRAPGW